MSILQKCLYIAIGGALGANARYWIGYWLTQRLTGAFPYATFFVNITGAFLLGLFMTVIAERFMTINPNLRMLVTVGFLGSYTTFSTFKYETFLLASMGNYFLAVLNVGLSVVAGFAAVWLGMRLVQIW